VVFHPGRPTKILYSPGTGTSLHHPSNKNKTNADDHSQAPAGSHTPQRTPATTSSCGC
jgi:hypothetical protein